VVHVDRVEWMIISDPATIAAAMASGEVDWWGYPTPDLVPLLRKTRGVTVKPSDPGGNMGILRFNHLQPPFDKLAVRQAVAMGMDRSDYLQVMGGDREFWVECDSSFPCGPGSPPPRKPDIEGARRLLKSSGYAGEPAVVLSAADQTIVQLQASVTADLLQRIGMTVDLQDMDSAGILSRRLSKAPVSQGGWSIFHTWFDASNLRDPAVNPTLSANGLKGWFGWPTDPQTEALITAWFDAPDEAAAAAGIRALDGRLAETVPFLITGQFKAPTATRSGITGVLDAPALFFWNVRKA
jgi:peptide/nickel transport system substrate-binding protein